MDSKTAKRFVVVSAGLLLLVGSPSWGKDRILDKNGQWTGLYNANPDPNGELWTGHKDRELTQKVKDAMVSMPRLSFSKEILDRQLPAVVNNTANPEFPPIFNQVGGSCAQASGQSYIYSYEVNVAKNRPAISQGDTFQFAYGFTYSFLNGGSSAAGTVTQDGWNIIKSFGAPTKRIFGGLDADYGGSAWMNGYEKWHKANDNKARAQWSISIETEEGIKTLKNWMYDHGSGDKKGGCAGFSSTMYFDVKKISSGPYKDSSICISMGDAAGEHAMTLAGYNDEIGYDINGDGSITNDKDINGDGKVDPQDWEKGAFLLVNSWGNWIDNGKVWVSYNTLKRSFVSGSVYVVDAMDCTPRYECKVKITSSHRNSFRITTGMTNDTAGLLPFWQKDYGRAFNRDGGDLPMEGSGGSSTLEFGLDVSDWADSARGEYVKFFFMMESNLDHGTIDLLSLFDYNETPAVETPFDIPANTPIKKNLWVYTANVKVRSFLTLSFPKGGEQFQLGGTYPIRWLSDRKGTMCIYLLKDNAKVQTIASAAADTGTFMWSIKNTELGLYGLRMEDDKGHVSQTKTLFSIINLEGIESYPYTLNFDQLDTGMVLPQKWGTSPDDDCGWKIWKGVTDSGGMTGPKSDHTSGSGKYAYIESSSPNHPLKKATLLSPMFNLKKAFKANLSFYYHMYSQDKCMGELHVDVLCDGLWNNSAVKIKGDKGDKWNLSTLDLAAYTGKMIQIRFRGITGESYTSDIAIDDIVLDAGIPIITTELTNPALMRLSVKGATAVFSADKSHRVSAVIRDTKGRVLCTFVKNKGEARVAVPLALSSAYYIIDARDDSGVRFIKGFAVTR